MDKLVPIELNEESFIDYGHVITKTHLSPDADNDEFKYWSKVTEFKIDGPVSTGILCPNNREMIVKCFERHINTIEVLVSLEGDSIICVGKKSTCDDEKIQGVQAFYIKQGDGIAIDEGIWHWVPYPIDKTGSKFLVMFESGTEDNDLQVKNLLDEIGINI